MEQRQQPESIVLLAGTTESYLLNPAFSSNYRSYRPSVYKDALVALRARIGSDVLKNQYNLINFPHPQNFSVVRQGVRICVEKDVGQFKEWNMRQILNQVSLMLHTNATALRANDGAEKFRASTKYTSVSSWVNFLGNSFGEPYSNPIPLYVFTSCAPNLMSSSPADQKEFSEETGTTYRPPGAKRNYPVHKIKATPYRDEMVRLFKSFLCEMEVAAIEIALLPLVGGGVYIRTLANAENKKDALKLIFEALYIAIRDLGGTGKLRFLKEVILVIPQGNEGLSAEFLQAKEILENADRLFLSLTLCDSDMIHLAAQLTSAFNKRCGIFNPGSDRTKGGSYAEYLIVSDKEGRTLEEIIFNLSDIVLHQTMDYNPAIYQYFAQLSKNSSQLPLGIQGIIISHYPDSCAVGSFNHREEQDDNDDWYDYVNGQYVKTDECIMVTFNRDGTLCNVKNPSNYSPISPQQTLPSIPFQPSGASASSPGTVFTEVGGQSDESTNYQFLGGGGRGQTMPPTVYQAIGETMPPTVYQPLRGASASPSSGTVITPVGGQSDESINYVPINVGGNRGNTALRQPSLTREGYLNLSPSNRITTPPRSVFPLSNVSSFTSPPAQVMLGAGHSHTSPSFNQPDPIDIVYVNVPPSNPTTTTPPRSVSPPSNVISSPPVQVTRPLVSKLSANKKAELRSLIDLMSILFPIIAKTFIIEPSQTNLQAQSALLFQPDSIFSFDNNGDATKFKDAYNQLMKQNKSVESFKRNDIDNFREFYGVRLNADEVEALKKLANSQASQASQARPHPILNPLPTNSTTTTSSSTTTTTQLLRATPSIAQTDESSDEEEEKKNGNQSTQKSSKAPTASVLSNSLASGISRVTSQPRSYKIQEESSDEDQEESDDENTKQGKTQLLKQKKPTQNRGKSFRKDEIELEDLSSKAKNDYPTEDFQLDLEIYFELTSETFKVLEISGKDNEGKRKISFSTKQEAEDFAQRLLDEEGIGSHKNRDQAKQAQSYQYKNTTYYAVYLDKMDVARLKRAFKAKAQQQEQTNCCRCLVS